MQLAFRKTAPVDATLWQRFTCWVIKARLVSQYCHGGIVIDGSLYHSTTTRGLHCLLPGEWTPERWELIDVNISSEQALTLFETHKNAEYDWFSLLAFVGLRISDKSKMYCFEWSWLSMTGQVPTFLVTPEMLLQIALSKHQ